MTLGTLLSESGMIEAAEGGNPATLEIHTECDEETILYCKIRCPLLYYLRDIKVQSFEPSGDKSNTLEIWLEGYKGDGDWGIKAWDKQD